MAIPFNLPTDEETEDAYRRLDQLLLDLYDLLRQIILRQSVLREPRVTEERVEVRPVAVPSNLPDVVVGSMPNALARKPPVPPPRRRRRRDKLWPVSAQSQPLQLSPSWINVGIELRQIAEEFTFNSQTGEGVTKKRREIKASSLFSLLVPAPITGSIWTTVIILVGWRILSRQR